jgi:hypothetical protein
MCDEKDDIFSFVYENEIIHDVSLFGIEKTEEKIPTITVDVLEESEPLKIEGFEATDRDVLEMSFRINNDGGEQLRDVFKKTRTMHVLVENNKGCYRIVTVGDIIDKTLPHMESCMGGALYRWTYRKRSCYALLNWVGIWKLYAIAPIKYKIDILSHTDYDIPFNYLEWDDDNFIYEVVLDIKHDRILPSLLSDKSILNTTFKDLSYCVAYVNRFVDRIRRGD